MQASASKPKMDKRKFLSDVLLESIIHQRFIGITNNNGISFKATNIKIQMVEHSFFNLKYTIYRVSCVLVYEDKSSRPFHMIVKLLPKLGYDLVPKYNAILNELVMGTAGFLVFDEFFFPKYYNDNLFRYSEYNVVVTNNLQKEGYYYVTGRKFSDEEMQLLANFMGQFYAKNHLLPMQRGKSIYRAICQWIDEHPSDPTYETKGPDLDKFIVENKSATILINPVQENFYFNKNKEPTRSEMKYSKVKMLDWHMVKFGVVSEDVLACKYMFEDKAKFFEFTKLIINEIITCEKQYFDNDTLRQNLFEFLDEFSAHIIHDMHDNPKGTEDKKKGKKFKKRRS